MVINHLIDSTEVDKLRRILEHLYENKIGFKEGALFDAVGLDDGSESRFPQITDPRKLAPELLESAYFGSAEALAKQILGPTAKLRNDIMFMKPARVGSVTAWHQDEAFANPDYQHDQISIWLALTQAQSENSCMSFVPGSHRLPVLMHQPVGGDPRMHALECIGDFDAASAVECPLQPGGCTIHDHRTLHYAGPNNSDRPRLAYVLTFDTKLVLRDKPLDYPWRKDRNLTARATREREWRRQTGMLKFAWRNRDELVDRGIAKMSALKDQAARILRGK